MINDYKEVKECVYKDEHYSVRDNGAIFRHKREGKRLRLDDERWTFGFKNSKTGYMLLGDHRVHIIVATAFLGERDSKKFVVDHIDTNRCNNRVENLRGFTRLENALNNEITRSKIIFICGSIEAFIENPNILQERLISVGKPSLEWMRTVTPEEAKNAYENVRKYWAEQAKNPKPLVGGKLNEDVYYKQNDFVLKPSSLMEYSTDQSDDNNSHHGNVVPNEEGSKAKMHIKSNSLYNISRDEVERSFLCTTKHSDTMDCLEKSEQYCTSFCQGQSQLIKAQSPETAWQKNWKTPAIFMCCPASIGNNPIEEYYDNLKISGNYNYTVFRDGSSVQKIEDKAYIKGNKAIVVLASTKDFIKLSKIYFSDGKFIHEYLKKFGKPQEKEALECFISEQGLECTIEEYFKMKRFSESNLVKAKSPETAWQLCWKTPTDFLCCPKTIGDNPIEEYYNQIVIGEAYNSTIYYGSNEVQKVIDKAHTKENTIIILSCNLNSIKPYALCKVHYFEGKFIHENLGTFFKEDGGRKYFTLEQGLEWTGGETFDDYC